MFATLLGALPAPATAGGADDQIATAIRAQESAGLEPITDGRLSDPSFAELSHALGGAHPEVAAAMVVARWRFASALTDRAVKQTLPGPYSLGRAGGAEPGASRERRTRQIAEAVGNAVRALTEAGCALVEIEETNADAIGLDEAERRLFRAAHRLVTDGAVGGGEAAPGHGTHLSLSIVGEAADRAGIDTILDAPYASLGVDLIRGPDNWNLVVRAPGDRGIVAGALSGKAFDEPKEILLWGAHYAASTGGRGIDRVGLGSAGSWAHLTWDVAVRKLQALGNAARLASMPPSEELARQLEPQAVSARRAGLGRNAPRPPRRC